MSGLPNQIPQQSLPIAERAPDGSLYVQFDWYLFLYNLAKQIFGTQGGGSTPAAPSDVLEMANLFAQTADIPQAYRGIENLAARLSVQSQADGADIARMRRDLTNAFLLAAGALLADPTPAAQPAQTVTVGASPFTYTALFNGTLSVTGGTVSAISTIRQGTTVATGITAGLVPVRRLDQVKVTYTVAPTVVFLPQ